MSNAESTLTCVEGYCELGMWESALSELDDLPVEWKFRREVLRIRLLILTALERWEDAVDAGEKACALWPGSMGLFLQTAYVMANTCQFERAWKFLLNAPAEVWLHAETWYTLACLLMRLGDRIGTRKALASCFRFDPRLRLKAVGDPVFSPLW